VLAENKKIYFKGKIHLKLAVSVINSKLTIFFQESLRTIVYIKHI